MGNCIYRRDSVPLRSFELWCVATSDPYYNYGRKMARAGIVRIRCIPKKFKRVSIMVEIKEKKYQRAAITIVRESWPRYLDTAAIVIRVNNKN